MIYFTNWALQVTCAKNTLNKIQKMFSQSQFCIIFNITFKNMTKLNVKTISYKHIVLLSVVLNSYRKFTELGSQWSCNHPCLPVWIGPAGIIKGKQSHKQTIRKKQNEIISYFIFCNCEKLKNIRQYVEIISNALLLHTSRAPWQQPTSMYTQSGFLTTDIFFIKYLSSAFHHAGFHGWLSKYTISHPVATYRHRILWFVTQDAIPSITTSRMSQDDCVAPFEDRLKSKRSTCSESQPAQLLLSYSIL